MKLKVDFAIVDVQTGRGLLRRALKKAGEEKGVPVVLYGKLVNEHGNDDGTSQEFTMYVEKCIVPDGDAAPVVADAVNRARALRKK